MKRGAVGILAWLLGGWAAFLVAGWLGVEPSFQAVLVTSLAVSAAIFSEHFALAFYDGRHKR